MSIAADDDLQDTVAHETVASALRGQVLPRWAKLECIVRVLSAKAVTRPNADEEARRFHQLWLHAQELGDDQPVFAEQRSETAASPWSEWLGSSEEAAEQRSHLTSMQITPPPALRVPAGYRIQANEPWKVLLDQEVWKRIHEFTTADIYLAANEVDPEEIELLQKAKYLFAMDPTVATGAIDAALEDILRSNPDIAVAYAMFLLKLGIKQSS
ncbi:hypothetical protein [Streptomyces katsurahamanus]|uniref:Uncharacterized protein n=1 Tax=Streptomyces katsurahamanus TaxID=2577098 RepID=A0ABW9NXB7_9ACTN|nr:hypothetical protein [Streptomyces katsurahamanus]MQS37814.1 hypothetical protein [Streptomyces katsurahamanus]